MPLQILLVSLLCVIHLVNTAPAIEDFTRPVNVPEDPTQVTQLAEVRPTASSTPISSCSVASSPSGPFVTQSGANGNFWVVYDGSSDLDYKTVNFYQLKVVCTDGSASSNEANLFLYVQPNLPPTITNYPVDSVTLDASSFRYATDVVYTVSATDSEGDSLTYSLSSQQPNVGLFKLDPQSPTKVKATQDLCTISQPSFVLTFRISDGKNTVDDFKVVFTLSNLNTPPAILNLPFAVGILETTTSATLMTLSIQDATPPKSGNLITSCFTSPSADSSKFKYDPVSFTITFAGALDYESRNSYLVTCSVNDGCMASDGNDVLTINVENVIEGVEFDSNSYDCSLLEGGVRNSFCTLPLTITDLDGFPIQTVTFLPSTDSDKFYYDKNTNRVYLNVDYDLDARQMPTSAELVLVAKDVADSTATASVHVTISDSNDNACHFNKPVSYQIIDQSTPLGTLDSFTVTDGDVSSPNNAVEVKVISMKPSVSATYISVSDIGEVTLVNQVPASYSGRSFTMVIRCRDGGTPTRSSLATVIVSYVSTTTTTPSSLSSTTEAAGEKSLWEYSWFVAVFSLLMLSLLVGLTALIAYIIYRCCCQQSAYPGPGQPHNKITPFEDQDRMSRQSRSVAESYEEDDYFSSSRASINNNNNNTISPANHSWQKGWAVSPRQLPALEYK